MAIVLDVTLPSVRASVSGVTHGTNSALATIPVATAVSPLQVSSGRHLFVELTAKMAFSNGESQVQHMLFVVFGGSPPVIAFSTGVNQRITSSGSLNSNSEVSVALDGNNDIVLTAENHEASSAMDAVVDCRLTLFGTS